MKNLALAALGMVLTTSITLASPYGAHANKGVIIFPESESEQLVAKESDESAVLAGKVCAVKLKKNHHNYKCEPFNSEILDVQFFYPDAVTEVTNQVDVFRSDKEISYEFIVDELQDAQSSLSVVVSTKKGNTQVKRLLRLRDKISHHKKHFHRRLAKIRNKGKKDQQKEREKWLENGIGLLESIEGKIESTLSQSGNIIARYESPIQIDNQYTQSLVYESVFNEKKLYFKSLPGSAIEGDKASIDYGIIDFPDKEEFKRLKFKNHHKSDDFEFSSDDEYFLTFNYRDNEVIEVPFQGGDLHQSFETSKLFSNDLHDFSVELYRLKKRGKGKDKGKGKGLKKKDLFGLIETQIPLASDVVAPTISDLAPEDQQKIKLTLEDRFGRIDFDSIKASLEGVTFGEQVLEQDVGSQLNIESMGRDLANINADFSNFTSGRYVFSLEAKDLAGNTSAIYQKELVIDIFPPEMAFVTADNILTNNNQFTVSFDGFDHSQVRIKLFQNDQLVYEGESLKDDVLVTLEEGLNSFRLEASDVHNNIADPIYLNAELDSIPPTIALNTPLDGAVLNTKDLRISGEVSEKLKEFEILGSQANLNQDLSFEKNHLILSEGDQEVTLKAVDLAGNVTTLGRNITIDDTAPVINILSRHGHSTKNPSYTLEFQVQELHGVSTTITSNGVLIKEGSFKSAMETLTLEDGENLIEITSVDVAGNAATLKASKIVLDSIAPVIASQNESDILTNNPSYTLNANITDSSSIEYELWHNGFLIKNADEKSLNEVVTLEEEKNDFVIKAEDAVGNQASDLNISNITLDTVHPVLTLNTEDDVLTNDTQFSISASVDDLNPGDTIIEQNDVEVYRESQKDILFEATLEEGNNVFKIKSVDLATNESLTQTLQNIVLNTSKPVISSQNADNIVAADKVYTLTANIEDDLETVTVVKHNGVEVFNGTSKDILIDVTLTEGANSFEVISTDSAGNVSDPFELTNISFDNTDSNDPEAYFAYSFESGNPLEVTFESLSHAQGSSKIESARYIINGGEGTIELSDTLIKSQVDYIFDEENFYNVELVVTDDEGRSGSFSRVLDITQDVHPPVLNLEVSQINPSEVLFDITKSFAPQGYIETVEIDFGDGNQRALGSLFETYVYDSQGDYQVTVVATDSLGNTTELSQQISVDENFAVHPPVADFDIEVLDFAGGFRFFFDESRTTNGEIVDIFWDLGDGQVESGEETVHYYEPGVYDVTLSVEDELGLTSSQTQRIVVHGGEPFIANLECFNQDPVADCSWSVLDSTKDLQNITIDWGDGNQESLTIFNQEYELYRNVLHEYSENGDFFITIQASNGNGDITSASQEVSIRNAGDGGSGGGLDIYANFECEVAPLNIECLPNVLGQDVLFRWMIDGQFITDQEELDFDFFEADTYEVTLEVTGPDGTIEQESDSYQVPEQNNDIVGGSLDCIREGSLNVRCMFTPFSSDTNYNYKWFIDDVEVSAQQIENQIRHEFSNFSEHKVAVKVSNETFESDYETLLSFNYEAPQASFSYALAEDDKMSLDASASESDSRHVEEFLWTIEGEESFTSARADFEIAFERVANKKVTLTVSDDSGSSHSIVKTISVDENYKAPVANINITQRRGRADRTVVFDASQSFDPNGQALNYKWTIDEQIFYQKTFSYDFLEHGEYEVELEVTNASGRTQEAEEEFVIEPLVFDRFTHTRFEPGDALVLFFENYRPDQAPQIIFNSQEMEVVQAEKDIWGAFYPIYDSSVEDDFSIELEFIIDDFNIKKTFYPKKIILSESPLEDIEQSLTDYLDHFYEGTKEFPSLLESEQSVLDLKERVIADVSNIDDKLFQQYTAYFLRKFLKEAKRTQVLTSFHEPRGPSLMNSFMGLFINSAHANVWNEKDLNARLKSCSDNLSRSRAFEIFVRSVVWGGSALPILFNLSGGALPAKAAIALAIGVGVFEVVAKIPHMAQNKRIVADCLDKSLFPYEGGIQGDKVLLEFTDSDIEQHNGKPLVPSGAAVDVRLTFPMVKFTKQVPSIQNGSLFEKIDNMMELYDGVADTIGMVVGITNSLRSLTKKAVENLGISTIERFGLLLFDKNVKGSLYIAAQDADELKQDFEKFDVPSQFLTDDRLLSIEENRLSNKTGPSVSYAPSNQGGKLVTYSLNVSNELVKPQIIKEKTEYFSALPLTDLATYYVQGICPGERVFRHNIFYSEGWVSENSIVAPEVEMTNTSYVCGESYVEKGFDLEEESVVRDSDLLGCGEVAESNVTRGTVIKDGVSIVNSQIEGNRITGSSDCQDPEHFNTVRLDGVSSPIGVEITADKDQLNRFGQFNPVHLSGDINLGSNIRILNSQIFGKASITGDTLQNIEHSNIFDLDFTMVGGNIRNSTLMGPRDTNSHSLKINGDVDISNGSSIFLSREFGSSVISKSTIVGDQLKLDNARISSEIVNLEEESQIINSTIELNQTLNLAAKYTGKILNAKNLKVLNSNVGNSGLADNVTIQNSSFIINSDILDGSTLSNTYLDESSLGQKNIITDASVWRLSAGNDVEVYNMFIGLSKFDNGSGADASDSFQKMIDNTSISAGVHVKNSDMLDSSATVGSVIENADIRYTDLKGNSRVVASDVSSENSVRRPIFGLDISGGSVLEHAGEIGNFLTISNSYVLATKIEQNVTIVGGSSIFFDSNFGESLEIGAFSTLNNAFVNNSSLGSSVEVQNSSVSDSTLRDGAKVLNSSGVASNSTLDNNVTVRDSSWVVEAGLFNGITVDSSRVEFVSISQNKQNNDCNPDNVDRPSTYIDEFGNEVENPCYNPIYFPGE